MSVPSGNVASRVILSIAISKQLNEAPNLLHKPWQLLREEIVLAVCQLVVVNIEDSGLFF